MVLSIFGFPHNWKNYCCGCRIRTWRAISGLWLWATWAWPILQPAIINFIISSVSHHLPYKLVELISGDNILKNLFWFKKSHKTTVIFSNYQICGTMFLKLLFYSFRLFHKVKTNFSICQILWNFICGVLPFRVDI